MLVEMGQEYKQDWYFHLPWVLLSRRVALQPDLSTSSSKLVFGVDPVMPGQLIGAPAPPLSLEHLKGLASHLEAAADFQPKQMSNHNTKPKKEYMPISTENGTHVYLKKDNPKGLLPSYTGPHRIVDRPSHSNIKVKIVPSDLELKTFSCTTANAKPAEVRSDTPEAQMPLRGRPRKAPPLATDRSDVQTTTESGAANLTETRKTNKKPRETSLPTRRLERILLKN